MDPLKEKLLDMEKEQSHEIKDRVEVVGESISSCLNRAGTFLNADLSMLDYEIVEKGKKSLFNPKPFRLLVSILPAAERFADLQQLSMKLGVGDRLLSADLDRYITPKNRDGRSLLRIYRSGVFLTIFPPLGNGKPADLAGCLARIEHHGIESYDHESVTKIVQGSRGEPIKIAEYIPRSENDSFCTVEVADDEMYAYVEVTPPGPGGRHLEVNDIVNNLKAHGVILGFKEEKIRDALLEDRYNERIVAAQGLAPKHGKDAYIDYQVKIHKDINLEEDEQGRVDFRQMDLVENVVAGQVLAIKIPAEEGVLGRTVADRLLEAHDGKELELKADRGTSLSDDKMMILAEINGQVVLARERLMVEPIYRVAGDVGPKTGNIMFLGSVVVAGSVLDNYEVKAAGNVEVMGSVQKAQVEAEGDIIVKQGIMGREEARVESMGGSLYAKFVQSAEIKVAENVFVQEGLLHSRVEAGGKILCEGRRAQIVGGSIRATQEIRASKVGSSAYTATEVIVGTDPRVLAQYEELVRMKGETEAKTKKVGKTVKTLQARKKANPELFTTEQQAKIASGDLTIKKLNKKSAEIDEELVKLDAYMQELGANGRVHVEKELFPGVVVHIKDAKLNVSDTYRNVSLSYDNGYVDIGKFRKKVEPKQRKAE